MRKIIFITCIVSFLFLSCELDNFEPPKAGISGEFIDAETGELVQQDIVQGTEIELTEHGYDPVAVQYLVVKTDGTYEHSKLFENTYTIQPVRGNFIPVEPQEIEIEPNTKLSFEVTPYIRLHNVNVTNQGGGVAVTFTLEQNVMNSVQKIGLYGHSEPTVGEPINTISVEQDLGRTVSEDEEFTLELDVENNSNVDQTVDQYFFRVGALIDIGQAKPNYAKPFKIEF